MRRVIGMGVAAAVLVAAAALVWVDVVQDQRASAAAAAPVIRYAPPTVEVAEGVDIDRAEVAAYVERIVDDPRGWRTDLGQWTVRIVQPGIGGTQGLGGLIGIAHLNDRLVLVTADAWTTIGPRFAAVGGTLDDQRTWVVLHELGHLLGHPHTDCPGSGPAPVMRAANFDLGACSYNVWPNP